MGIARARTRCSAGQVVCPRLPPKQAALFAEATCTYPAKDLHCGRREKHLNINMLGGSTTESNGSLADGSRKSSFKARPNSLLAGGGYLLAQLVPRVLS